MKLTNPWVPHREVEITDTFRIRRYVVRLQKNGLRPVPAVKTVLQSVADTTSLKKGKGFRRTILDVHTTDQQCEKHPTLEAMGNNLTSSSQALWLYHRITRQIYVHWKFSKRKTSMVTKAAISTLTGHTLTRLTRLNTATIFP